MFITVTIFIIFIIAAWLVTRSAMQDIDDDY